MGLRELREKNGNTRREIARLLGCTEQTIINIEKNKFTGRENLLILADFYNVSTDEILGRTEEVEKQ